MLSRDHACWRAAPVACVHSARGMHSFPVTALSQDRLYPLHTGSVEDVGAGRGRGYNLNVPLPPGSGWGAYDATMQRVVAPALRAFKPDLIMVSSGTARALQPTV